MNDSAWIRAFRREGVVILIAVALAVKKIAWWILRWATFVRIIWIWITARAIV